MLRPLLTPLFPKPLMSGVQGPLGPWRVQGSALAFLALLTFLTQAPLALAAGPLAGQGGMVEWRVPNLGAEPAPAAVVTRDFAVGGGREVTDLGFYPSLSLDATDEALVFSFSEGWCCLSADDAAFVGPVITFTSLPDDEDLEVTIGDGTIPVTLDDVQVTGNRIAVDLRGRDISGGRLTLLVGPGSNLAERATLALVGIGLIALGTIRRRWLA